MLQKKNSSSMWNCQPYDLWLAQPLPEEPRHLDGFVVECPMRCDFINIIGGNSAGRDRCRIWEYGLSDVEGCMAFTNPKQMSPDVRLSSSGVPVLCLFDELSRLGWVGVSRKVDHRAGGLQVFDKRTPSREYLQAVVASADLFAKGCLSFTSQRARAYYVLLMKAPATNVNVLSSKACAERLKAIGSEALHVASLDRPAPVAVLRDHSPSPEPAVPVADLPEEAAVVVRDCSPNVDGDGDASDDDGDMRIPDTILGVALQREDRCNAKGEWQEGVASDMPHSWP